jgi:Rhomboid family
LTMLLALTASAVLSRTAFHALSDVWLQRLGFALNDIVPARFWRLLVSALVTPGALYFWFDAVAIAVLVGLCERLVGSWRAALAFWGVHVGTGIIEAIVGLSASRLLHSTLLQEVVASRTVGPSAGYLACLGVAFALCPRRQRNVLACVAGAALTAALFWAIFHARTDPDGLIDGATHAMALPLGWWLGTRWRRRVIRRPECRGSR